jgi:hypothetical protein
MIHKFRLATLFLIMVCLTGFSSLDQSSNSLTALLLEADALHQNEVIVPSGEWTVTEDLEIDRRVSLTLQPGALIQVQAGCTLRVHGQFIAPMNSIFGSEGKVVFSGEVPHKVLPAWWGAKGDGRHDDTESIQRAIDSLEGGEVSLGRGTYLIGASTKVPGIVFLTVKANITLSGAGRNETVLKVRDNSGPYHYIMTAQAHWSDCSGFRLRDLTIDSNIANNPIRDEKEIRYFFRMSVALFKGSDIAIERVGFRNESSINTVSLNGAEVQNVRVIDCLFDAIGDDPNHVIHDHSSIYTHADNVLIRSNEFHSVRLDAPGGRTAIETHGSDTLVAGNLIFGYQNGMNITGISRETSRKVIVRNNHIQDVNYGILLWSYTYRDHTKGYGFDGIDVENNFIQISQVKFPERTYSSAIFLNPGSDLPVRGLRIKNNEISFDLESGSRKTTADSFGIGYVSSRPVTLEESIVTGNTIANSPASAIRFDCAIKGMEIAGNTILNPGSTTDNRLAEEFRVGIHLASDQIEGVVIQDNKISDLLPRARLVGGIYLGGNAIPPNVTTKGNTVAFAEKNPSSYRGMEISPSTW